MSNIPSKKFKTKSGKLVEIKSLYLGCELVLHDFQRQIAIETTHTLHYKEGEIPLERLKEAIERTSKSHSEIFLGVFDNGLLVGTLNFRAQKYDHPWVKHIGEFGMGILKSHWNQGIGKELLSIMERFAQAIGITRIEAKVRCQNERGVELYKRFGFKIEGIRERGALINGIFEDEYFIAKLLHSEHRL